MIGWYLLAAYLGFGLLTTALMWYTDWRDENLDVTDGTLAVPTVLLWPMVWVMLLSDQLKAWRKKLEGKA